METLATDGDAQRMGYLLTHYPLTLAHALQIDVKAGESLDIVRSFIRMKIDDLLFIQRSKDFPKSTADY